MYYEIVKSKTFYAEHTPTQAIQASDVSKM